MAAQMKGKHIVVIGAGVVGLQTAVSLLEAGCAVTVIAKHVPGDKSIDYTSPWAGAQWRTHATAADKETQEWDVESYNTWFDMLEKEKNERDATKKSGLAKFHSVFYWTHENDEIPSGPSSAWWAPHVRSFRVIPSSSLPSGMFAGATYDSLTIDTTAYLPYLVNKVTALGGKILKAELPTTSGLGGALATATRLLPAYGTTMPVDAFVNATGILARELVPDPAVHSVRGQTVLVRGIPKQLTTVWRADSLSYVIPRGASNATILGGTKQEDDWRAEPDPATTKEILERCKEYAPELLNERGEFDVLSVNVGFRPGRWGGPRVEIEDVRTEVGKVVCCHEYGHAGAGYQNSFGSATKVINLLQECFEEKKNSSKL